MPLLTGPLFSLGATGKFNKSLVYQGTIRGPTLRRLGRLPSTKTPDQLIQQSIVAGCVKTWQIIKSDSIALQQWTALYTKLPAHQSLYSQNQRDCIHLACRTPGTGFSYRIVRDWAGGLVLYSVDVATGGVPSDVALTEIWQGDTPQTMSLTGSVAISGASQHVTSVGTPGTTRYVKLMRDGIPASGLAPITFIGDPPELVVNGGFATDSNWTKSSYWTIVPPTAHFATSVGRTGLIYQLPPTLIVGHTYRSVFTITTHTSGNTLYYNLGNTHGTNRAAAGTYTEDLVNGAFGIIGIYATATGIGAAEQIDNVSLKDYNTPPP